MRVVPLAVMSGLVILLPTAASAQADEPSPPTAYEYPSTVPLADSRTTTLTGTRAADGTCDWAQFPPLELGPGPGALTTREIGADSADCTTTVETGVPPSTDGDRNVAMESAGFTGGYNQDGECPYTGPQRYYLSTFGGPIPAYNGTGCYMGNGYFRVNWFDIVGIKVNEVTNSVSWTVDGACVTDIAGHATGYWLHTSGWRLVYGNYRIEPISPGVCADTRSVISNAEYLNPTFCTVIFNVFASPSKTKYEEMMATVHRVDYLGGQVQTDNSGGQLCPPLHHEEHLTRTW